MFAKEKSKTPLELAIDRAMQKLGNQEVGSEDYTKTLEAITKLHKMREDEKPRRVDPNTAAMIGANLLGIMMIIRHEHVNVITSRAMSLVTRTR